MGTYVGIIQDTFTPPSIVHPRPSTTCTIEFLFSLCSPVEILHKAKDGGEGQAIRGGKKPKDLLGKEVQDLILGGFGVAREGEHFTQYDFFDGADGSVESSEAGGDKGRRRRR